MIVGRDYYEPQGIDPKVRHSWAERRGGHGCKCSWYCSAGLAARLLG